MVIDVLKDCNAFIFMVRQSKLLGPLDLQDGHHNPLKVHYCLPVDIAHCPYSKSDVLSGNTCTDGQSYFNSCCRKM